MPIHTKLDSGSGSAVRATSSRCKRVVAFTAAAAAAVSLMAIGPFAGAASAGESCGANEYIVSVTSEPVKGPDFRIIVTPTAKARSAAGMNNLWPSTVAMWHAVQGCVPGLYHSLADSIWQQLECHQMFGAAEFATGPTYDLESWRPPLTDPNPVTYAATRCLNTLNEGGEGSGINFPGYLDLRDTRTIA